MSLPRATGQAIFATAFGLLLGACETVEVTGNHYPNHAEVVKAGAIAYGFVPAFLPDSAVDIREAHGVEQPGQLVSFTFDTNDTEKMFTDCKALDPAEIKFPRLNVQWWPSQLTAAPSGQGSYDYFRCTKELGYLAIDSRENRAFYWR